MEALSLTRSIRNAFAPINRIPPEVLSLVGHHCNEDSDLIALTHVCCRWREIFISYPPLWTNLDCRSIDKTLVYLERSKAYPLETSFGGLHPLLSVFVLTLPHLVRLKSLSLYVTSRDFIAVTKRLGFPAPLLEDLRIVIDTGEAPTLQDTVFDGDLSSLRKLHLSRVTTTLAWKSMSNLQTFTLQYVPSDKISVDQLLRFFERAPLLRNIELLEALPDSSDVRPGRVVPLRNLKYLYISANQSHAILLNHLSFPTSVIISQNFTFNNTNSPIPLHLPRTLENLDNISNVVSVNLSFYLGVDLQLWGPSGGLHLHGSRPGHGPVPTSIGCEVLRSLNAFHISEVETLKISRWPHTIPWWGTIKAPIYQTFVRMGNLRALKLIVCINSPFFIALNPKEHASRALVCPKLEELAVYSGKRDSFCGRELLEMAKERASRGAKLKVVTVVGPEELAKEVFKLRAQVEHVEHRWDCILPL